MNKVLKAILCVLLALISVFLVYKIVEGVMQPVHFNKQVDARKAVAIQQLKDIRDLQVAFKSVNDRYTASFDTLKQFYNEGKMEVVLQIGSKDDSLAVAHTAEVRKANKGITDQGLYDLYKKGDNRLVFTIPRKIAVKDTLFTGRTGFDINSIDKIPFVHEGLITEKTPENLEMSAIVKTVSGVQVPLFEAKMPYWSLLNGLDHQLIVNMVAELEDQDRFPGLQVGSVTTPNNNAGNWE
ncbi:MAG: hypothetical protein II029_02180 [Bacteroidales bacterium]|jgi:hypothetical protein|nr:hypothetical protein [Bacteroidales bacterium]